MDKHIEMSFCDFEAFKILAHNYLNINTESESHHLFPKIRQLLEDAKVTPADIAENLMPKSSKDDAEICLERVIQGIEVEKEEAAKLLLLKAQAEAEEEQNLKSKNEAPNQAKENGDVIINGQ